MHATKPFFHKTVPQVRGDPPDPSVLRALATGRPSRPTSLAPSVQQPSTTGLRLLEPRSSKRVEGVLLGLGLRILEVVLEHPVAGRLPELAQRLGLDLPDALACDAEDVANLLQRAHAAVIQPVAQAQHVALARRQRVEHVLQVLLEEAPRGGVLGRNHPPVLDGVLQLALLVVCAQRRLQRQRQQRRFVHSLDLLLAREKRKEARLLVHRMIRGDAVRPKL
eukprot:1189529-Prorocentrum_minimum.AAC.4